MKLFRHIPRVPALLLTSAGLLALALAAEAQVLPEDRADALYHSYDGGGVEITGPSLLVRKQINNDVSLSANYYVDSISSASIDVLSYASPYSEERTEVSFGSDVIVGEAIVSAGYTYSDENDFTAKTGYVGISQEIFGGLTTVRLGFARGDDEIGQITDSTFEEEAKRRIYRLGVSQVVTKNLVMNLDFEGITDEGFLNNPYRQVRYVDTDPNNTAGYAFEDEVYPDTRTSGALAAGARYFLNKDAAVYGGARYYDDDWEINAWNANAGYTYRWRGRWLFDVSFRYYDQSAAEFYSDLFPFRESQTFRARDKELSTYTTQTLKFDVSYDMFENGWSMFERGTANFSFARIQFDYDDFRDIVTGGPVGEEPLYSFDADVIQLWVLLLVLTTTPSDIYSA